MAEPVNLVALRDAREQAERLLSERYAEDLINQEELERRIDLVEGAKSLEEIGAVTQDLVDPNEVSTALTAPPSGALVPVGEVASSLRKVTVLSEMKQRGAWQPARTNQIVAVLGSAHLDFRQAPLGPGVTTVEVQVVLGEVKVVVPPGLPVDLEVTPILGSVDLDDVVTTAATGGDAPRLRITGTAVLGSVEVRERLPGESERQAKKRREADQKKLTSGRH